MGIQASFPVPNVATIARYQTALPASLYATAPSENVSDSDAAHTRFGFPGSDACVGSGVKPVSVTQRQQRPHLPETP
jgi:hypothetical protein